MGLKISCNSAMEATVRADQLNQGEVGKVVTVDNHSNCKPSAVGKFLVRASKYDAEGAVVFLPHPQIIKSEHLHHYQVVRMPSGTKLTIEVE